MPISGDTILPHFCPVLSYGLRISSSLLDITVNTTKAASPPPGEASSSSLDPELELAPELELVPDASHPLELGGTGPGPAPASYTAAVEKVMSTPLVSLLPAKSSILFYGSLNL